MGNKEAKDRGFENVRRLRHLMKGLKTEDSRTSRLKHWGVVSDILIQVEEVE